MLITLTACFDWKNEAEEGREIVFDQHNELFFFFNFDRRVLLSFLSECLNDDAGIPLVLHFIKRYSIELSGYF
jgi:hypothetical protein